MAAGRTTRRRIPRRPRRLVPILPLRWWIATSGRRWKDRTIAPCGWRSAAPTLPFRRKEKRRCEVVLRPCSLTLCRSCSFRSGPSFGGANRRLETYLDSPQSPPPRRQQPLRHLPRRAALFQPELGSVGRRSRRSRCIRSSKARQRRRSASLGRMEVRRRPMSRRGAFLRPLEAQIGIWRRTCRKLFDGASTARGRRTPSRRPNRRRKASGPPRTTDLQLPSTICFGKLAPWPLRSNRTASMEIPRGCTT
mmetsp:Transcript_11065/g.41324  ORF Transcript_11065/g.41324 Transcript_11065/m.41324 type:complete len:250 (+) Transcript_11065:1545-2294(+)